MSYRKPRVHQTGKSNADVRTISTTPVRDRIPLHERSFVQNTSPLGLSCADPIENTMQKYKTWNKKMKSASTEKPSKPEWGDRMKEDPPDYYKVHSKVESLRQQQLLNTQTPLQEALRTHLKTQGYSLRSQFMKADKSKKGVISFADFKEVMENSHLPPRLTTNLAAIYKELGGTPEGIDYGEVSARLDPGRLPRLPDLDLSPHNDNLLKVVDKKQAPLNQLENIYNTARAVRQFLKAAYASPEALLEGLRQNASDNRIAMESLKDFVVDKVNEMKTHRISKREMEGFLASYDYNKDSQTSVSEIVKYVFMDDILAASHLHAKKRAIPPLREASKHDMKAVNANRLKKLLVDIEEKMFVQGPMQSLSVFRTFDKDGDGYITVEDLEKGLTLAQVEHSSQDTAGLMNFLDDNQNGYLTFNEFSKKIQSNILTVNREKFEESDDKHFNISQPSGKYHEFQQSKLSLWKPQEVQEHRLKYSTRYSSTPAHQDTFVNFAPKPGSAMYMPENERLSSKKFEPININHDDKSKMRKSADARMVYLQKTREVHENRIQMRNEKEAELDSQKIMKKAKVKSDYETKCRFGIIN